MTFSVKLKVTYVYDINIKIRFDIDYSNYDFFTLFFYCHSNHLVDMNSLSTLLT